MKHTLAHAMRRTARLLIRQSNRLDPPVLTGIKRTVRDIGYAGQTAGAAIPGLMETFVAPELGVNFTQPWAIRLADGLAGARPALPTQGAPVRRSLIRRLMDWLERTDWGYGLGLLTMVAAAVIAFFGSPWWWISAPLVVVAFVLCWWFG